MSNEVKHYSLDTTTPQKMDVIRINQQKQKIIKKGRARALPFFYD